ncbi:MAG: hypothetical protein WAQ52_13775 [Terriglobales bacterium]
MSGKRINGAEHAVEERKSGFRAEAKGTDLLSFSTVRLGQGYPQHCPQSEEPLFAVSAELGEPMSIREVAAILGCSEWTIRQRYLPLGLPHFRLSRTGKLLFFHNQIVRWVLEKQRQKGGIR